jgi:hypothetical protein
MTNLFCTTDGAAIYSIGDTPEKALQDLRELGGVNDEVRDGYQRDGKLSLIGISPELYETVKRDGGCISFDIDGYGRRAVAVPYEA